MNLHRCFPLLIVISFSVSMRAQEMSQNASALAPPTSIAPTKDFARTVLPITELKFVGYGVKAGFGTGFCLDPQCRFIGTTYHLAALAHPGKIKGQKVVRTYLATGPNDEDATINGGQSMPTMKYTIIRDLAIFELRHPLPYHNGASFNLGELQPGQEVDIYAYPIERINPIRKLMQFHGTFKGQTPSGLLVFDYNLYAGKGIRAGASGGIVVDSKTHQIVGILNEIATSEDGVALAVPVQSLADFVSKVQPFLAQSIFPSTNYISPVAADFYPEFVPPRSAGLQQRPEEPLEIRQLRAKAQILADSIRDFIAVQTFAWGSGNAAPVASSAYEVRVLNGYQRFRKYPDGKEELQDAPRPNLNNSITPGGEWSELPQMVGTEPRLKIQEAPEVLVNGRPIRVFQYRADFEDRLCNFETIYDFVVFSFNKIHTYPCYGEVWTDEHTNILRISRNFPLSDRWKNYRTVVTYGWLRQKGETPRLIPLTIYSEVGLGKKVYWCRGEFTDYEVFSSKVKILSKTITP